MPTEQGSAASRNSTRAHRFLGLLSVIIIAVAGASCAAGSNSSPDESASPTAIEAVATPERATETPEPSQELDSTTGEVSSPEPIDVAEPLAPQAETQPISPIDAALGAVTDPEALSQAYGQAYLDHADHVTSCMREAGFDFTYIAPPTPPASAFMLGTTTTQSDLIQQYGYGVARTLQQAIENRSEDPTGSATADNGVPLSASERAAQRDRKAFCLNQAADNVRLPNDLPLSVTDLIAEFRDGLQSEPFVQQLWSSWSSCMQEAGFAYQRRQQATQELAENSADILLGLAALPPGEPTPESLVERSDELTAIENRIVAADLTCASATDLDASLASFTHDEELKFLEENGDKLTLEMANWRAGQ